jgi:hypothetical protein
MSKVSFSRELLGVVRFVFDKTKSRTLNATQAYDKSPSQIVLASYPATASKKLLTKNVYTSPVGGVASVNSRTSSGGVLEGALLSEGLGKSDIVSKQLRSRVSRETTAVDVNYAAGGEFTTTKSKQQGALSIEPGTATFSGVNVGGNYDGGDDGAVRSKKTKEIYYGAMTVGTGDYRTWQGKYAVLKVDLLTNNAILRVYNS